MKRAAKIATWSIGIVGLLVVGAIVAVHFLEDSEFVRSQVAERFSGFSGKKTTIGKLSIDWGSTSHVHLSDLAIANASWGKAAHMLKAEEIDFDIQLWPLLHGEIVLPRLSLRKPEIHLERNDKDQSNWSTSQAPVAATAAKAVKPEERHQTPLIGRLEIIDGKIGYTDLKRKLDLEGTVSTATGKAGAEPQAELTLKGNLQSQPLTVHFLGGSALLLRETNKPYPVDLDVAYGGTRLKVKGTLQDPMQWKGANVQIALSGPDLSDIFPLLGIPGPPTPPYELSGRLDHSPGIWRVDDLKWHAGDSDLAGDIAIDQHTKPSHLTAKLTSERLTFKDLAPLIGASPGTHGNVSAQQKEAAAKTEAKGNLFPDVPLHVERLRAMNMDVSLDAKRVIAPAYLPVQALDFRVLVDNGQANVRPLRMKFGGGSVIGDLGIDAQSDIPKVHTDLDLKDIDLAAFFRGSRFFDTTKGLVQGQVSLAGTGRSLAQVMGSSDGHVSLAMAGGNVSNLMVSLAGLQIADALVLYVTGNNKIPLRCALGRLDVSHGQATFENTVVDTPKSVLHLDGQAALSNQVVMLKLTADPKHFDLLDLHAPVLIQGKIRSPNISIARTISIPTPVIGTAKDVQCEALTNQLFSMNSQKVQQ
ncbi:MAG TPA: AsmA family protein [Stellaceae bacterium]|nr:AsmA family protein [Stellaceae bacterium]